MEYAVAFLFWIFLKWRFASFLNKGSSNPPQTAVSLHAELKNTINILVTRGAEEKNKQNRRAPTGT
jgi:hypothetical protein